MVCGSACVILLEKNPFRPQRKLTFFFPILAVNLRLIMPPSAQACGRFHQSAIAIGRATGTGAVPRPPPPRLEPPSPGLGPAVRQDEARRRSHPAMPRPRSRVGICIAKLVWRGLD